MAKNKSSYVCQHCGAHFGKWAGQCTDCGEWNSLVEAPNVSMPHHNKSTTKPNNARAATRGTSAPAGNYSGTHSAVMPLNAVSVTLDTRLPTGISEFDRVLGGGLVAGSVVLIGGDPG
ncbi:MAG: DNA repair protein RadA, partial [Psychrobacter sp.]